MSCHGSGSVVVLDNSLCTGCPGGSDWTECINASLSSLGDGGTLQFERGEEYVVSDTLWINQEGMTCEAVGAGVRPIIRFTNSPHPGGVMVKKSDVTLRNLDIRGPHYQSGGVRAEGRYGVSAAQSEDQPTSDRLHLANVSANGFEDSGLLVNGPTADVLVENSQFEYNGGSGIQLFPAPKYGPAPAGVTIQGTILSHNGEDGIDSSAVELTLLANSLHSNGWANVPYGLQEGHGILLNADPGDQIVKSVLIQNNYTNLNDRNGIYLHDPGDWGYDEIEVKGNYLISNGQGGAVVHQWGVLIDTTLITNSSLEANDASDNATGCYNVPSSGVTVGDNCCDGSGGPGPGGAVCLQ